MTIFRSSSIQTLLSTQELHLVSLSARGLYRRSGITPCPEDPLFTCIQNSTRMDACQEIYPVLNYNNVGATPGRPYSSLKHAAFRRAIEDRPYNEGGVL